MAGAPTPTTMDTMGRRGRGTPRPGPEVGGSPEAEGTPESAVEARLLEGGQLQLAYRLAHPGRWLLHVALRPRGVRGGDGVVSSGRGCDGVVSSGRGREGADEPLRDSPIEVLVRAAGCDPLQSEAFGAGGA